MSEKIRYVNLANYRTLPQLQKLSPQELDAIEVVAHVFPFKVNRHVVENLIDWDKGLDDPLYRCTFPHADMLEPEDYAQLAKLVHEHAPTGAILSCAKSIRNRLTPHPADQRTKNVPQLEGRSLEGMQHKYRETILFFPQEGQDCHSWCAFCFRWPQFVASDAQRFATRQVDDLQAYLRCHPDITDILFTGGDPLSMSSSKLASYVEPLLTPEFAHLRNIRLGTKALAWWPQRFLDSPDSNLLLDLFSKVAASGRSLDIMSHFVHPRELTNDLTRQAIAKVQACGATIRCQCAMLRGINDDPATLEALWREEVHLGCLPYYLFVERDTGARRYFEIPLIRTWQIAAQAISKLSGLGRTVRGPVMSCSPGKVVIDGPLNLGQERALALRYLQARKASLVQRPFLAKYTEKATWWDQLEPFGPSDVQFFA